MAAPYPFFTSAYPAGTYSLEVEDVVGVGGAIVCPVTITTANTFFELPDTLGVDLIASGWPAGSLVRQILTSLQAVASYSGTWRAAWIRSAWGASVAFQNSATTVEFKAAPASGAPLPLPWIGYPAADVDSKAGTTRTPFGCWYPRAVLQDLGDTATPAQVFSAGPTADGSFHTVQHDTGARPRWYRYLLDGSTEGGVDGGRMMQSRLADTWRTDWASGADLSASDPYAAFDAVDGWWYRTLDGTPFKLIRSMAEPASSITGRRVFVFPGDSAAAGMPVAMTGWLARGEPNILRTRAGRRLLDFCCTDYVP